MDKQAFERAFEVIVETEDLAAALRAFGAAVQPHACGKGIRILLVDGLEALRSDGRPPRPIWWADHHPTRGPAHNVARILAAACAVGDALTPGPDRPSVRPERLPGPAWICRVGDVMVGFVRTAERAAARVWVSAPRGNEAAVREAARRGRAAIGRDGWGKE